MRRRIASLIASAAALGVAASALVAVAAAPREADAATAYTIRGAGFGHGVGMSQYGAEGMARKGHTHRSILARYYPGTELGAAPTERTRVLLAEGAPTAEVSGVGRIPGRRSLDPDRTYRARGTGEDEIELRTVRGRLVGRYPAPLALDRRGAPVRLAGRALNGVDDGGYRGALLVHPAGDGVTVVNDVSLEDYLRGVVPGEMPASWRREALRAQAVAARSYALATARRGGVFDQYPDTRSQVYEGVTGERPETDAAVAATKGRVVLHRGAVATTFFHSTSGGRTESSANAFGGSPRPYLRGVDDPEDRISPHHRWSLSLSGAQIEARLGSLVAGRYRGVDVLRRGDSPRVLRAEVVGTGGRRPATGAQLRARLGLRDTWAFFGRIDTAAAGAAIAARSPSRGAAPAGVLAGRVTPAPRGGAIVVERRGARGWRRVGSAVTDRTGAYRVSVTRPGRYRVRAEGAPGPVVRVEDGARRRVRG
jgi:stage II sporulation protein D